MQKKIKESHIPVLFHELVGSAEISASEKNIIIDCTLGFWWHAKEIIKKMKKWDIFIWFDADEKNLNLARENISSTLEEKEVESIFIHSNFLYLKEELEKRAIDFVTYIYYDLWLSSMQVDDGERGFSFKNDGPLDMRFDKSKWKSAFEVVNFYKKDQLIKIFREYGEENLAKKIAENIETERKKKKITTTKELANIIDTVRWDPKTKARIFQAIRIEVNNELENIEISIKNALEKLKKWGRIFIITFHSLEDRIVKNILRDESKDCICSELVCNCKHKKTIKVLTKKPIIPSVEETKNNPRARSAKARIWEKI